MTLTVTFQLDEEDLKHFRHAMEQAGEIARKSEPKEILESARGALSKVKDKHIPHFIAERMVQLEKLIAMAADEDWAIPEPERGHVLSALSYFGDPHDLIPDDVPGIGFLDDAIMVELVIDQLEPELQAYEEFCRFRERKPGGKEQGASREEWLESKRSELHSWMRQRRRERQGSAREHRPRFTLW